MPACTAAPYPSRDSRTTRAPWPRATSAVASREPLSTTITEKPGGTSASRPGSAPASSWHGSTRSQSATISMSATLGVRSGVPGGWRLRNPDIAPSGRRPTASLPLAWPRASRPLRPRSVGRARRSRSLLIAAAVVVPPLTHWQVQASLHPVRPFAPLARYVEAGSGRARPAAARRGRSPCGTGSPRGAAPVAGAARHDVRRHRRVDAVPRARRRSRGTDARDPQPQRVPAHRPPDPRRTRACCAASWTGSPPARPELGDPRRGPPAGRAAPLRRPRRGRAGRRPCDRAVVTLVAAHDPGGRAGDPAAARRGGRRPTRGAVPGPGSRGDLGRRCRRTECSPRSRPGAWPRSRPRRRRPALGRLGLGPGRWAAARAPACCSPTACSCSAPLVIAVLLAGRSWRPAARRSRWAHSCRSAVFAALGFRLWEAYPVLQDRYWAGIAAGRPAAYWFWGDLAALAIAAGPAARRRARLAGGGRPAVTARRAPARRARPPWRSSPPTRRG